MGKPRDEAERERDRIRITPLYLEGWNQTEIAQELGIDQSTVSRDIKVLKTEWRKQRNGIVDEFEGKYRFVYREAIAAWKRSLEDTETIIQEMIDNNGGELGGVALGKGRLKASTRKEGQSGNPALLAQAQGALKAIREMFGVDAATKTQNLNLDLSQLTNEQLQRIAAGDDPAAVLASPGHFVASTQSGG